MLPNPFLSSVPLRDESSKLLPYRGRRDDFSISLLENRALPLLKCSLALQCRVDGFKVGVLGGQSHHHPPVDENGGG
jgi:hypothetical protein